MWDNKLAERVGFEPTYSLLDRNPISSRARYDPFGTSPVIQRLSESRPSTKDNWGLLKDVRVPNKSEVLRPKCRLQILK
jgi:hypothetical protein